MRARVSDKGIQWSDLNQIIFSNFFVQISFGVRQAHMYVFLIEIFQVHFHFVLHRLTKAHNRYISSRYLARKTPTMPSLKIIKRQEEN